MPSKRQPSKQRRAAQNRAQREALAARREHASQPAGIAVSSSSRASSSSSSTGAGSGSGTKRGRSSFLSGLTGGGGGASSGPARPVRPLGGLGGQIMGDTAGDAGARGVLLSLPLGIAAAVYLLGFAKLDVDDRGEPLPINGSSGFRGLYLATREALTGQRVTPHKELGVEAIGTFWLLMVVIPLLVVLGVFVVFRFRRAQSTYWTVTIGMLLIAATVLLLGRIEYIGAMGALTWASFQIRRAELPGKMAEREAVRAARAEAAAAEAEEDDDEDDYDDDEYVDEEAEYDEDDYEEEAEYDEDDDVEEDDDVDDDEAEEEAEYDEAVDEADDEAVDEAEEDVAEDDVAEDDDDDGYDDDVLKELQAEIDESEGRSGSGGTRPGPR